MKTRRDFLKKAALFGASAFTAPSLLGQEREEACFFLRNLLLLCLFLWVMLLKLPVHF